MRSRRHEAGRPEPGVEWRGLAKAEFAHYGALQARSERGCGGEPESRAHRHPEDADVRVVGEPEVRERGDGFQQLPPSLFEHPAAELSVDDSAQLCEDRRQPDHIA